uniref:Phospholipase B1, membrane-associated n=1 Tax=Anopheles christyi TaxID=43041 RepID=A0A182JZA2_9DIPT
MAQAYRRTLTLSIGGVTLLLLALTASIMPASGQALITPLDSPLLSGKLRGLRGLMFNFIGQTGNNKNKFLINLKKGKVQKQFGPEEPFFCNTTGMRSETVPTSVDKLRPGDIDIVGAIGDSLTAGNGAMATNILEVLIENKGLSWSIGGQGTWRQFLTLPNILKEYNPKLYGYPTKDGLSTRKSSLFNAAEGGAMSQDIPYQARNLVKRMLSDRKVDIAQHWKMITLMIGGNDFCAEICYMATPEKILQYHEKNIVSALRTFRDYLPRTFVNLAASPKVDILARFKNKPQECVSMHVIECPCLLATRFRKQFQRYVKLIEDWNQLQMDIAAREEFHSKPDFAVVYQPFTMNLTFPATANGDTDFTYMSLDCFHLSQKGYALASNALWNNMLEPVGGKSMNWEREFTLFKCPSDQMPFLRTPGNILALFLPLFLLLNARSTTHAQEEVSFLDDPPFISLYRKLHSLLFNNVGTNSDNPVRLKQARSQGKIQFPIPPDQPFPCSTEGMRSPKVPTSAHQLRPGDIDVVAALGDSLTAGTGILATDIVELVIENRGLSWCIGGQGTWRQYLTLPNILKVFNPNLNGYVVADSLSIDRASRFDVAEIAAMSQDLPHQARNLIKRMQADNSVDIKKHWKLITIFMGHNDFCSRICFLPKPEKALYQHEQNLLETLRLLRKYLPRAMINIVAAIDVTVLRTFNPRPAQCITTHAFECPCVFGASFASFQPRLEYIIQQWNRIQQSVAEREEFNSATDFVVNYQPFPEQLTLPTLQNGDTDAGITSVDCFHFSQRGHAIAANSYWNNLIDIEGNKSELVQREFERFNCPMKGRPFLATRKNSLKKVWKKG